MTESGLWLNIKMSFYRYRKSHCGDKTVVRSSYLHNGISYTGKMTSLYWISLNSQMIMKWCPKLDVAYERCPFVFEDHPSNFKVIRLKISSILTQTERLRSVTPFWIHQWLRSEAKARSSIEEVPYCVWKSSDKFQGHTAKKMDLGPNWALPDCNASLNSPKAMQWCTKLEVA